MHFAALLACIILAIFGTAFGLSPALHPDAHRTANSPLQHHKPPALFIRLSKSGVQRIQDFVIDLFEEHMRHAKFTVAGDDSLIWRTLESMDVEIFDLKPADRYRIRFEGGYTPGVYMSVENLGLMIKAKPKIRRGLLLHLLYIPDMVIYAQMKGIRVSAHFLINFASNVIAQLKVGHCEAAIASLHISVDNAGPLKALLDSMTTMFNNAVRKKVADKICTIIERLAINRTNKYLSQIQTKRLIFPLPDKDAANRVRVARQRTSPNAVGVPRHVRSSSQLDYGQMARNVMLDFSIVELPVINGDYIETRHSGEVSWQGRGGTPVPLRPSRKAAVRSPNGHSMITCSAHVYVFNTLIYTLWTKNYFNFVFNRHTTPGMAKFLEIDCETNFECMGTLLPVLQERFSGYYLQITFRATTAPFVEFHNGLGRMHMAGPLSLEVRREGRRHTLFRGKLHVVLAVHLIARNGLIVGNMTLSKFDVHTQNDHEKLMNLNEAKFVAYIWKAVLETKGNELLHRGFRLPSLNGIAITHSSLRHVDDAIQIDLDFAIDQSRIADLATDVMKLVKGA
ncbi:unnamed protein product [Soboliphyme baturini]|uniref:BPI2 domain-containing protein n=1 Tax=Soboliphyme baturini TaxID=241478 RepID=A0A183IJ31_9BILA|nr:unnamed protein product [Soboliphyme baturini]